MTQTNIIAKIRAALRRLTFSALFLALALLLPFVTGQIPEIGALLSPMHLPAFLCGYICGPFWGAAMGLAAPLLRHLLFGMPPLLTSIPMAVELAAYAALAAIFERLLPKKNLSLYLSLTLSMIGGRLLYALVKFTILGLTGEAFTPWLVLLDTVTGTWAGILLQIALVPPLVRLLRRITAKPSI